MTQDEAIKSLDGALLPPDETQKLMNYYLAQTRRWEDIKPRLQNNLNGNIAWTTPIFRVVPLTSFLRLLVDHTCLFTRPDSWEDPYENYWLKNKFKDQDGNIVSFAKIANAFYAQCWSRNTNSVALWKTATQNPITSSAIRIESTIEAYCRALCTGIQSPYRQQIEQHLYVGEVTYKKQEDIDTELDKALPSSVEGNTNALQDKAVKALLTKRDAFSFEEEVRFIFDTKDIPNKKFFTSGNDQHQKTQLIQIHVDEKFLISNFIYSVEVNPWCQPYEFETLKKVIAHFLPNCAVKKSPLLDRNKRLFEVENEERNSIRG